MGALWVVAGQKAEPIGTIPTPRLSHSHLIVFYLASVSLQFLGPSSVSEIGLVSCSWLPVLFLSHCSSFPALFSDVSWLCFIGWLCPGLGLAPLTHFTSKAGSKAVPTRSETAREPCSQQRIMASNRQALTSLSHGHFKIWDDWVWSSEVLRELVWGSA